jgi:exonuclease SbcC
MHRVTIHNFQSHKDTVLELSPTVNSLEGVSDSGKSAVLRAMLWCLTNKPDGVAFASNWAKDKKGKLKDEVSVSIDNITRSRNATVNGYTKFVAGKDPQTYEALKGTVPPDIENAINIGSVNIQRQMDPPFLLSSTPGDAARYVNELIGLEEIDTYQKALKGKAHDNANSLKDENKRLADAEAALSQYDWVAGAKEKVEELSGVDAKCTELEADLAKLSELDALNDVSAELKAAKSLEKKVTKLISSCPDTEKLESEVVMLKQVDEAGALTAQLIESKAVVSTADDKIIALSQINTASLETDLAALKNVEEASDLKWKAAEGTRIVAEATAHIDELAKINIPALEAELSLLDDSLTKDKGICNELFPAINMMPRLEALIKDGATVAAQIEAATNDVAAIDEVTAMNTKIAESRTELYRANDFLKGKACPVCGKPL